MEKGEDESESAMAQEEDSSWFRAGPIARFLAIPVLAFGVWLAFTGFVVVPPGELAVVVTLVRPNIAQRYVHTFL